ncbi:MAG TPA: ferritin [Candidatus Acidoferrum sp.]|nr:ferritin [Candidatus Acidoferrum sp.]
MKLSNKLEKALNDQISLEYLSAFAYLGMAAYFDNTAFTGFAKWMQIQSQEELGHAQRFFKYVVDRGGKVALQAIPQPKCEYKSPLDAFRASLGHEQKVSAAIYAIYELAGAEKDYATLSFLKWFLDEQVEEEKNVTEIIAKLELIGENHNGLFHMDKQAAKRAEEKEAD